MPYARRGRRKRKPKGRVYKTGIPRKALSGAIDTAIERRQAEITRKILAESQVKLIDRNYFYGAFDPVTNFFQGGRRIFYDGVVQQLARIDKMDINMVANAPDADAMEASGPRQEVDADGAQQGATTTTLHGKRQSDLIKITGFTCSVKAFLDRFPTLDTAQNPNAAQAWFARSAAGCYVRPLLETIILRWRIVQVTDNQAAVDPAIQNHPSAIELLPLHSFGYSASLDNAEKLLTQLVKSRTLLKGSMSFNVTPDGNKDKTANMYVKLKKPITMKYLPADQNGQQSVDKRFYFVARSNVPHMAGTQNVDFCQFAPRVHLCLKTHYTEP